MKRRNFLKTLAVGTPITAWAFGPTQQKRNPGINPGEPGTFAEEAPTRVKFECIIGDTLENENGRTYNTKAWSKMLSGNLFVLAQDANAASLGSLRGIELGSVVGQLEAWRFQTVEHFDPVSGRTEAVLGVWIRFETFATTKAKALVSRFEQNVRLRRQAGFDFVYASESYFVTPVGVAGLETLRNGIVGDDYQCSYLQICNNSAFQTATPLKMVENTGQNGIRG